MNFLVEVKKDQMIEIRVYQGFDDEFRLETITLEQALVYANEENQGHCHDGYMTFHVGEYEVSMLLDEEDSIVKLLVDHLAF